LRGALFALVCLLAALAIRAPLAPHRLYNEDSVTLARAVDRYDPRHLFPQPPGYPLFILQSKILRAMTGDVERAFFAGVVLASAAALFALIPLAGSMGSSSIFTLFLLMVNPIFLFTGMTSPIRIYLAAVSAIVALFCWRAWNGDSRAAWFASIALGIGSGYRPELLALLAPLWAVAVWRATRSWRRFLGPALLLSAISALWIGFLLSRFPDFHAFQETFAKYISDQSRDTSPIFGATNAGWVRMLFRVVMWNGTAIFGWIALLPLCGTISRGCEPSSQPGDGFLNQLTEKNSSRPGSRLAGMTARPTVFLFIAVWTLPSIAFHALIHVEDPDQTLSTIPAFCILGGAVLASFWERNRDVAALGLASAVIVNLALFVSPFPLRPKATFYKPAVDALWQASYVETANVRAQTDATLAALQRFSGDDRTLVIWNRSQVTWRALSYYDPHLTFCLLMDDRHAGTRPHAAFWRDLTLRESYFGDPAVVPLGDADELVWVLGKLSPVRAAIEGRVDPVADGVWQSKAMPMSMPGYKLVW
jgi:hypothetical protein